MYDDKGTVTDNKLLRPDTPWGDLLTHDFWGEELVRETSHKSFRPVTTATFRLNYATAQLEPYEYKVTNIILHGAVSAATYVATRLSAYGTVEMSAAAAALFAAHPIHTEAVCNVSGRAELLMSIFYLLGVINYVALGQWYNRRIAASPRSMFEVASFFCARGHCARSLPHYLFLAKSRASQCH